MNKSRIAATADLHGLPAFSRDWTECPLLAVPDDVDIVTVSGDILPTQCRSAFGQMDVFEKAFLEWCKVVDRPVVFTLGNHDYLDEEAINHVINKHGLEGQVHCLVNNHVTVNDLLFYGNPWTLPFCGWAYNAEEDEISTHLENMSDEVDVFLTHGPPFGYGDQVLDKNFCDNDDHLGSHATLDAIRRSRPQWVFAGHIHTGSHEPVSIGPSMSVNVSLLDEQYRPAFPMFTQDIYARGKNAPT